MVRRVVTIRLAAAVSAGTQDFLQQAMRNRRRPEDEDQCGNDLVEAEHTQLLSRRDPMCKRRQEFTGVFLLGLQDVRHDSASQDSLRFFDDLPLADGVLRR